VSLLERTINTPRNILITGGRGFLGQHLTKALEERGHRVASFDIVDGQDLLDYNAVEKAVAGKDAVYHLAAVADLNYAREHPRETMDINIVGTINVADVCARRGATLHYASTCCAYGNPDTHPVDETTHPKPTEIYAHSKLAGEHIILGYASQFNLPYTLLRLATFYGEGMRAALAPFVFLKQAIAGEPITIHGTGEQTRTFTHVSDIVEGIARVVDSGVKNEIINITTEEEVSVNEMAQLAKSLAGGNSEIVRVADRPGQIHKEEILAAKAEKLLNWKARVSFQEGMRRSYEWMKTTKK
jgi:nucleoside-diphosphate-sugar epimerase